MGKSLSIVREFLAHPLTRGLDIDDPTTTLLRQQIILEKLFLKRIYEEWYISIAGVLPSGGLPVLELGSGAGFMHEFVPDLIASDMFPCQGLHLVADGQRMPFSDQALRGVVMVDVLHHIPQPCAFFNEAARCVCKGGVIAMVEPWVSPWSRLIYTKLHHEPFLPDSEKWEFATSGPLSGANGAMPWIIFERDRERFNREFPQWEIEVVRPMMPLRYLFSGGGVDAQFAARLELFILAQD